MKILIPTVEKKLRALQIGIYARLGALLGVLLLIIATIFSLGNMNNILALIVNIVFAAFIIVIEFQLLDIPELEILKMLNISLYRGITFILIALLAASLATVDFGLNLLALAYICIIVSGVLYVIYYSHK